MPSLNGIIPPVPTPFDNNGDLYLDMMQKNLNHLNSYQLKGYLFLGSNGELVMLSEKERLKVLESARPWIPEDKIMMAGTGCQSTKQTIDFTNSAAEVGVNIALVLNPSYYKSQMNSNALVNHYMKVADSVTIPVMIYNMPANSGIDMDHETIFSISQHPHIIGLKDSGGDVSKLETIAEKCDKRFQIMAGGAGFFLPALTVGATGGILALANILPQVCIDLQNMFNQGKIEAAKELQTKLISINNAITRKWGIPALKASMDLIGLYGGPVREPLLPIDQEQQHTLKQLLDEMGILRESQ
jgi:4-hydroxy-2-oxoglutarate aldolase